MQSFAIAIIILPENTNKTLVKKVGDGIIAMVKCATYHLFIKLHKMHKIHIFDVYRISPSKSRSRALVALVYKTPQKLFNV